MGISKLTKKIEEPDFRFQPNSTFQQIKNGTFKRSVIKTANRKILSRNANQIDIARQHIYEWNYAKSDDFFLESCLSQKQNQFLIPKTKTFIFLKIEQKSYLRPPGQCNIKKNQFLIFCLHSKTKVGYIRDANLIFQERPTQIFAKKILTIHNMKRHK